MHVYFEDFPITLWLRRKSVRLVHIKKNAFQMYTVGQVHSSVRNISMWEVEEF